MWSASTLMEVDHFRAVILLLLNLFYFPCVNIKTSNGHSLLEFHISRGFWHPKCERFDHCLQAWISITQLQTLSEASVPQQALSVKALNRPVCDQARCGAQIHAMVFRFHCIPTQACALHLHRLLSMTITPMFGTNTTQELNHLVNLDILVSPSQY